MSDNSLPPSDMDDTTTSDTITPNTLPLLAVRDVVVYPNTQIALFVGRKQSINAIKHAQRDYHGKILLVSQKDSLSEEINPDNLHTHGTVCKVISTMPHDSDEECLKVLLEGTDRVCLLSVQGNADSECLYGEYQTVQLQYNLQDDDTAKHKETLLQMFEEYAQLHLRNVREIVKVAAKIADLSHMAYFMVTRTSMALDKKLALLAEDKLDELLGAVMTYFADSKAAQEVENDLQDAVRKQMETNHREYYLKEKMQAIKDELADIDERHAESDDDKELEKRLNDADLPDEVRKKAQAEFKKLGQMPPSSSEAAVVRGYIEWILDTPWHKVSDVAIELHHAKEVLDSDHYGLDDVKDRILEYLAVQSRVKSVKGSILCLVGPPGVGKTSLGESIARATGRKFVRMALGGVRDEAEIRGHRRTYIGAMPGKIVQSLAKVEVKNPLFLLDEIDKMAQDFRGDPASALLEVLDPSQNTAFNDHYLDLDLDLSQVMFICTANSMNIPPALLDRMEIIRLSGYTEDEKLAIAKEYLAPKALQQNGLQDGELDITDDAITSIVRHYTREAGVRNLEREINKISRKAVRTAVEEAENTSSELSEQSPKQATTHIVVDDGNISDFLGVKPYDYGLAEEVTEVGRITGLAWTSVGGELLTIEAVSMVGKGELIYTGSLGDVMKESIRAAMSVVRANGDKFGISYEKVKESDIHVHMPEGATPKDGPSAGIALTTALVSALTGIAIRPDIAMTGEVTLRGRVLRIGGLKEKLLAAHRGGIKHVLIPKSNERDLVDIPDNVKDGLHIQSVESIHEVLQTALVSPLMPLTAMPVMTQDEQGSALKN